MELKRKLIRLVTRRQSTNGAFRIAKEERAKAGINFTLENYGKTLIDLARYDRGEKFSG